MTNQDYVDRYIESKEVVKESSRILSYFFDESCKEQIPTRKVKETKTNYKQKLNPHSNQYEMVEEKNDVEVDTGKIDLVYPDKTIQGESQSMIFYVRNELKSPIELEPFTNDKHLTFTEYPKILKSKQIGKVRLTFTPSFNRFEALEADFDFNYIIHTKA